MKKVFFIICLMIGVVKAQENNVIKFISVIQVKVDSVINYKDSTVYWITVRKSKKPMITLMRYVVNKNDTVYKKTSETFIDIEY